MGIIKKNKISFEDSGEKTPLKFSRKEKQQKSPHKKKNLKKRFFIGLALVVFLLLGYFGIRAYNSIRDVFSGGTGILNLLGGAQGQLLKGEIDGRVNILLLGVGDDNHAGSTLSDTIIVASYDTKTKAVSMISIPRDFYAEMPTGGYAKINTAHSYGEQNKEGGGPEYAKKTVEKVSGLPIHYYARVNFTGLMEIVDALGGVTVDVERGFCDYGYEGRSRHNPVCFKAGPQLMNGETALKYARSRKSLGLEGSDFARSKRQQNILIAIKEKALSTETAFNPSKVLKSLEALGKHLKTDFDMNEIARLYEISKGVDRNLIIQKNLDPTTGLVFATSNTANGYVLIPVDGQGRYSEIHNFFANIFAGVGIQRESAKISFRNGTWSTLYYTNLYNQLESDGYKIVDEGGATTRNYLTSQIVDYTGGQKPETVQALEELLGVKARVVAPVDSQVYEIQVILGSDFRG